MTPLLAQGRKFIANHGNAVYYAMAVASYHLWTLFPEAMQERVFCGSIAIAMAFVCFYFVCERGRLIDRVFLALAINNAIEELGFGDPNKFTLNEYLTAVVITALTAFTFYKSGTWKTLKKE